MVTLHSHNNIRSLPISMAYLARAVILLTPTVLLAVSIIRRPDLDNTMLWIGCGFQIAVCALTFMTSRSWHLSLGPSIITLYLIGFAWLSLGDSTPDWFTNISKSILLIVPLVLLAFQTLVDSGAPAIRRAQLLAQRLANRKEWPEDLSECRTLPEVKALRAALTIDATPALALLHHARIEVRVAALFALEFRKDWRPGQAELVLQLAQHAEQPAIRAAAMMALGNIDDRNLIETVALFLHDPSKEVRQAATEALLWDTDHRWNWIRFAVRRILADPLFVDDGPLAHNGQLFSREAVNDLTGWCAEKGVLSMRAAQTLAFHYSRALTEEPDVTLVESLLNQVTDSHNPPGFRLELARLLKLHRELTPPVLCEILKPSNPASLRLIACETILSGEVEDMDQTDAVAALRELARLPNREIALRTADLVQRRLGVDLGLAMSQPLPPVHTRQAAEITRRVMMWATQNDDDEEVEDSRVYPQKIRV